MQVPPLATLKLSKAYTKYLSTLEHLQLPTLEQRRNQLLEKFAKSLVGTKHMSSMLPPLRNLQYRPTRSLRNTRGLLGPFCRTNRYQRSAIPQIVRIINSLKLI